MNIRLSFSSLNEILRDIANNPKTSGVEVSFVNDLAKFKGMSRFTTSEFDSVLVDNGNNQGYLVTTVYGPRVDNPVTR